MKTIKNRDTPKDNELDFSMFGERVRFVREKILGLSQIELAEQLHSHQVMISRLESGIGVSFQLILHLINYLHSKNIDAEKLFAKDVNVGNISLLKIPENQTENNDNYIQHLQGLIKDIKNSMTSDLDKISSYAALLKYRFPEEQK